MISPEDSCLSPGAYGAFAISEALLYRTKVPDCELLALYQFQEWMKRQNGNAVVTGGPCVGSEGESEEPDSPDKMSRGFSFEDPAFFDDSQVNFIFLMNCMYNIAEHFLQSSPLRVAVR